MIIHHQNLSAEHRKPHVISHITTLSLLPDRLLLSHSIREMTTWNNGNLPDRIFSVRPINSWGDSEAITKRTLPFSKRSKGPPNWQKLGVLFFFSFLPELYSFDHAREHHGDVRVNLLLAISVL
jgi:hypothetical protein